MSIFRYNLNFIKNIELRKYLHSKFDFEKWEEAIAENAILAHFSHISKISYGFPMAKNQFIIMKRLFKKIASDFVLPYIIFNKKNVKNVLFENSDFFTNSIYYLRNEEGKKEIYNYNLNSIETAKKTIMGKLKDYDENVEFILEKLDNNLLLFNGNSFEIRTYVLVIQIDKKTYTFLYPLLIAHFGIDDINMLEFMKFLDI
jgi:hypothetical protein